MKETENPTSDLRPTSTIEDYLIWVYIMERDGEEIVAARLAEALGVSPPTVTITLKRMERDGWLVNDPDKHIRLSPTGHEAAQSVLRRHMLTEWVLADMLGVAWSQIHTEAHRIEHTISNEIEARMRDSLNSPKQCPHGNPIPGFEHLTAHWAPLTELQVGEMGTMRRVHELAEDNSDLMAYLEKNGLLPGRQVKVSEILPFNQTITLEVDGKAVMLGYAVARYIFFEKK
jgi:DtxR family transcriptional regulator, Mn-dependent transcriptional regulator